MLKSLHPIFYFFASLFMICTVILVVSCSDKKAQQMLELAEFEELQMNDTHAEEIYRDIVKKYPDTEAAKTATKKIKQLEKKKQLPREPEKRTSQ